MREVVNSHVNYVVADTRVWEQAAAYVIDTHPAVQAFVKNAGLGFAIPIVRVKMNASLTSVFGSTSSTFKPSGNEFVESRSGSASGIGDVVLRAKYNVVKGAGGGLAAAADIRLGTGDEMNFLGVPGSQVKLFVIASTDLNIKMEESACRGASSGADHVLFLSVR